MCQCFCSVRKLRMLQIKNSSQIYISNIYSKERYVQQIELDQLNARLVLEYLWTINWIHSQYLVFIAMLLFLLVWISLQPHLYNKIPPPPVYTPPHHINSPVCPSGLLPALLLLSYPCPPSFTFFCKKSDFLSSQGPRSGFQVPATERKN